MNSFNKAKVEIFHRINKLKLKAGAALDEKGVGFLDEKAIKRAQAAIDAKVTEYTDELESMLARLNSTWNSALENAKNPEATKQHASAMHNYANNIKDLAATYDYDLMEYFGHSLRDFCEKVDFSNKAHKTIVQAHIDVMTAAWRKKIKGSDEEMAKELKETLAKAIEQHS